MAKGIMCAECCYLDKTRKQGGNNGTGCFRYGCKARIREKFICGWVSNDNELKTTGCSDCNRIKVGTSFTLNKTKCFYCGSIQTKNGRMYLIYNASTYIQNGYYVDVVEQNWFSEHIKEIVIEYQTKEQIEAIKQTARHYKKRIEEREKRYKQ
jgi:hypothetical protein|nr:MAG TPA: hypothetical protein [Caudoviricetes sp.]